MILFAFMINTSLDKIQIIFCVEREAKHGILYSMSGNLIAKVTNDNGSVVNYSFSARV